MLDREFERSGPPDTAPPAKRPPDRGMVITLAVIVGGAMLWGYFHRPPASEIPQVGEALPTPTAPEAASSQPADEHAPAMSPPSREEERRAERRPEDVQQPEPRERSEPRPEQQSHARREESDQERPRNAEVSDVDRGARGWYRVRYRSPLFREPKETAEVITRLPKGTRLLVRGTVNGFFAVESTTGKAPGYVATDDVERAETREASREQRLR